MMLSMTETDYENCATTSAAAAVRNTTPSILRRPCTKAVGGPMQFPT